MKKFLNSPESFVDDMIDGLLLAHPGKLKSVRPDRRALTRVDAPVPGKVGLVTGGGSGHLPLFLGYVGSGMLDGVAVGDVFASPSAKQMLDATRAVSGGAGVLYIYGNYGGDVMNFDTAAELAGREGIPVETVVGTDDVASMPAGAEAQRRGIAGIFFVYKTAGAKAEQRAPLEEVKRVAQKANARVRTMGVALSPCILPAIGRPNFKVGEGQMEIGMGIHGEPGIEHGQIASAANIAGKLVEAILTDMPVPAGGRVAVLVNGLGATPLEELYVVYATIHRLLVEQGISVHATYVGEYATSLEMCGLSVSLLSLDDELQQLLDAPFETPFHKQFQQAR